MLELINLHVGYNGHAIVTIPHFTLDKGQSCLIKGKSGCGKTTLLHAMAGIGSILSGSVTINGKDIYSLSESSRDTYRGQEIGFVFQNFHLIKSLTVHQNILLGAYASGQPQNLDWSDELTTRLGIQDIADQLASDISHGQAQRAAIARALINKPSILMADEPTSSLDATSATSVISLLKDLTTAMNLTLIVSSHDDRICDGFDKTLNLESAI